MTRAYMGATTRFFKASFLATVLGVVVSFPVKSAQAQNLGPFRQFLGLEGGYDRLQLDDGAGGTIGLNGFGSRLWLNLAPFSGPGTHAVDKLSLAFFYFRTPARDFGVGTRHYGAEVNIYPLLVPIAKKIDPFLSVGLGALRIDNRRTSGSAPLPGGSTTTALRLGSATTFAVSPGIGFRIPFPNRFQIRLDARDLLGLNSRTATGGSRTSQSWQFTGSLGLTF